MNLFSKYIYCSKIVPILMVAIASYEFCYRQYWNFLFLIIFHNNPSPPIERPTWSSGSFPDGLIAFDGSSTIEWPYLTYTRT